MKTYCEMFYSYIPAIKRFLGKTFDLDFFLRICTTTKILSVVGFQTFNKMQTCTHTHTRSLSHTHTITKNKNKNKMNKTAAKILSDHKSTDTENKMVSL